MNDDRYKIAHLFADIGCESEALAGYGTVHRYTLDPEPNDANDAIIRMDLMETTPTDGYDLALLHPVCSKWTDMPNVDPDDHPNQIPRARVIGRSIASDYVIENKPRAPLADPTTLHGRMFGLPIAYERSFESSFQIEQPPQQQTLGKTVTPYFYSDRTREWWKSVKGYNGHYGKQHLAKNALPRAYVDYIVRCWLESLETRDAEEPQDNNSQAPREKSMEQSELTL